MANGFGQRKRYPRAFLRDVEWDFAPPTFRSQAQFVQAVKNYYREMGWEFKWNPDEVVLPCPRVRVRPVFWDDYDPAEEPRVIAELSADSPSGFTAGELLFKAHNVFVRRWQEDAGDYIFFEGFHRVKVPARDGVPLYAIEVGS
jgi:hypothetical protein